jgi:hypothetical protein
MRLRDSPVRPIRLIQGSVGEHTGLLVSTMGTGFD